MFIYMYIPTIYGDLGGGSLLFYPHYIYKHIIYIYIYIYTLEACSIAGIWRLQNL